MNLSSLLLLAALVDAVIAVAAALFVGVLLRDRPRVSAIAVAAGASAALAAGFVQAVVLLDDGFSKLHLAYLVVVVSLPVLGAVVVCLLVGSRRTSRLQVTRSAGLLGVALLGLGVAGWWGTHVEPFRLRTDRVELDVAQLGPGDAPIRVGVLADLQTRSIGAHEWAAVRRLNEADLDIVVLPGDFIQGNEAALLEELPELQRLLGAIEAPSGVFLVAGDTDSPQRLDVIVAGTDLEALNDELASVTIRGRRVWIGGLALAYDSPAAAATIDELAGAGEDGDLRLLISHRPDAGYLADDRGRIDLVLAGHTHGGQVALPFIGPPITLSDVPREVGAGGLHDLGGQSIYVGTGVGLERSTAPQVRFLVRPSVGVVTLR